MSPLPLIPPKVDSAASKVRWRRIVYCTPGAVRWLMKAKELNATLPIPRPTRRRALRSLRGKLGFAAWPKDILRHTAASMLMASLRSRGKLRLGKPPGGMLAAP